MPAADLLFYPFSLLAVGGALLTITQRNPVRCAIALIGSLLGVAGLYLLQSAEFLFAAQILVYVGGIMLLFLFAIMLVNWELASHQRQFSRWWPAGAVFAAVLAGALIASVRHVHGDTAASGASAAVSDAAHLGDLLYSAYLIPFELLSLILLVAAVGSLYLARRRRA